jgi:hypothetical protein
MVFGSLFALLKSTSSRVFLAMAEVVHDAQQEFWRPPAALDAPAKAELPSSSPQRMAEVCGGCSSEFMIGARFCHTCGLSRPAFAKARNTSVTNTNNDVADLSSMWTRSSSWIVATAQSMAEAYRKIPFPSWLNYLHFHEIKRWVGLPTAALVAFMIGLGCVAGALGVSFFYKASNLAEFQAIQLWRIEWLLAATASFVAGILLKKPSDN